MKLAQHVALNPKLKKMGLFRHPWWSNPGGYCLCRFVGNQISINHVTISTKLQQVTNLVLNSWVILCAFSWLVLCHISRQYCWEITIQTLAAASIVHQSDVAQHLGAIHEEYQSSGILRIQDRTGNQLPGQWTLTLRVLSDVEEIYE